MATIWNTEEPRNSLRVTLRHPQFRLRKFLLKKKKTKKKKKKTKKKKERKKEKGSKVKRMIKKSIRRDSL